jgi:hypothetical protein
MSNVLTGDIDICVGVYSVFVLFLIRAYHSSKEPNRLCNKDCGSEEEVRAQRMFITSPGNPTDSVIKITEMRKRPELNEGL